MTDIHDEYGLPIMDGKYIQIRALPPKPKRKTRDYAVTSKSQSVVLGTITWYGAWRQYTFKPEADTIWSHDCLQCVRQFIQRLMAARR